ncbi:MAG TPA: GNAT family N-acetyltransferase [Dermatophilaceae bacterium]|nr:GNAT family N-acetyltransferase [Dermatophilaceae bacterium]
MDRMPPAWTLRQADPSDSEWMAELRAAVMRADLQRLGRWDPIRVRQRFLDGFRPAHTQVIEVDAEPVGLIAVRPEADAHWIEHFYLDPAFQGRGIGTSVLEHVMADSRDHRPYRLNVLQGSPARRLYERHGFVHDHEDPIDVFLVAHVNHPATRTHSAASRPDTASHAARQTSNRNARKL